MAKWKLPKMKLRPDEVYIKCPHCNADLARKIKMYADEHLKVTKVDSCPECSRWF